MNDDTYPDSHLRDILRTVRTIAVVGASPKPERPSHSVMRYLLAQGYRCIPINPGQAGGTILDRVVHARLGELMDSVDMVDVFRNSAEAGKFVDEVMAMARRPRVIWMQLGIRDDAAAARAEAGGLQVVMNRCPAIEIPRLFGTGGPHG